MQLSTLCISKPWVSGPGTSTRLSTPSSHRPMGLPSPYCPRGVQNNNPKHQTLLAPPNHLPSPSGFPLLPIPETRLPHTPSSSAPAEKDRQSPQRPLRIDMRVPVRFVAELPRRLGGAQSVRGDAEQSGCCDRGAIREGREVEGGREVERRG
jgi:hypothetical protein